MTLRKSSELSMVMNVIIFGLLAYIATAQVLPLPQTSAIVLLPDCVSGTTSQVCVSNPVSSVVQTNSLNPFPVVGQPGWSFNPNGQSPVDWRIYSSSALSNPIANPSCAGVTFAQLGAPASPTTGTVFALINLPQASNINPVIRLSTSDGCSYTYSLTTALKGGPIYLYTNRDFGYVLPDGTLKVKLNGPTISSACNGRQSTTLQVASIDIGSNAVASSPFVLYSAGYATANPANCAAKFQFLFLNANAKLNPIVAAPVTAPVVVLKPVVVPVFVGFRGAPAKKAKSPLKAGPGQVLIVGTDPKGKGGPKGAPDVVVVGTITKPAAGTTFVVGTPVVSSPAVLGAVGTPVIAGSTTTVGTPVAVGSTTTVGTPVVVGAVGTPVVVGAVGTPVVVGAVGTPVVVATPAVVGIPVGQVNYVDQFGNPVIFFAPGGPPPKGSKKGPKGAKMKSFDAKEPETPGLLRRSFSNN